MFAQWCSFQPNRSNNGINLLMELIWLDLLKWKRAGEQLPPQRAGNEINGMKWNWLNFAACWRATLGGAGNYERQRKAQQAKRNKFLFVGRCSWRSLIDCGAVLPPSINSLRFRHNQQSTNFSFQFDFMALNEIKWRKVLICWMFY